MNNWKRSRVRRSLLDHCEALLNIYNTEKNKKPLWYKREDIGMRKLTSGFTLTSDVILRLPLTSDDFASRFNWSLKSSRTSLSRTSSSICWSPRKSRSGDFEVDKSTDPRNVLAVPEIWRVPSAISLLSYLHLNDPCGSVQLFLSCRVAAWYHADAY